MAGTLYLLIGITIMTASAYVESKHGKINYDSEIVYPGPRSEPLRLDIPKDCKELGFCERIGNYPYEEFQKAIQRQKYLFMFQTDKLDMEKETEITDRIGPLNENEELCDLISTYMYPQAAIDSNNKWHVVLNHVKNFTQGYKVEICKDTRHTEERQSTKMGVKNTKSQQCRDVVSFGTPPTTYESRCKQKFAYLSMVVLHKGKLLQKYLKVPICCSCVVKQKNPTIPFK